MRTPPQGCPPKASSNVLHTDPVLFKFPSRHQALPSDVVSTFCSGFDQPTGLHPTLRINFPSTTITAPRPPQPSCVLHAYLTLPSFLFIDRYALADSVTLSSHNLVFLRSLSGATDLEAPDWAVNQWGSAALFQLSTNNPTLRSNNADQRNSTYSATIPLHLRYLKPAPSGYRTLSVPPPSVFWACAAEDSGARFVSGNPFDRTGLGYDGLFGERTLFYHFAPVTAGSGTQGNVMQELRAPVLDSDSPLAGIVEWGTVAAVLLGFAWICWKLFGPLPDDSPGRRDKPGKRRETVGRRKDA